MTTQKNPYLETELKYFLHTFKRQPLLIKKAKDIYVWDDHGRRYVDFFSGLAVCGVGHGNARVVKAIQNQSAQLIHSSNFFYTHPQLNLAKALTQKWPGSRVFFSNSGAEANELAIKLARLWGHENKKPGRDILVFENAFHGRTLATAAASSGGARKKVFEPLPTGFKTVPFNNLKAVHSAINKKTLAILVEPIQGEGGINVAEKSFFVGLKKLCQRHKLLLIIDEIQSGMGRTGTFFAFEQLGVQPDIVTLAKGLAGGMPLAATLAQNSVAQYMVPGLHGSTFGGNPVSCAASLEVLKLLSPQALKTIQKSAASIFSKLADFARYPSVKTIRGKGLMVGIELHVNGLPYVELAREKGLLINCTQEKVLRFLPPYFTTKNQIEAVLAILKDIFESLN